MPAINLCRRRALTVYYLSGSTSQPGFSQANNTGVAEATSLPAADVVVSLGADGTPVTSLSRGGCVRVLQAIINYINSDGFNGSPVLPFGSP
jgi:hypothetical protein